MLSNAVVIKAGSHASLQDFGRLGYAHLGVPMGGVVDVHTATRLHKILGNKEKSALLEWSLLGPTLLFEQPTFIALSEISASTKLNGKQIRAFEKIYVSAQSTLQLGHQAHRVYSYLAVSGGFKTSKVLESRSMLKGITKQDSIQTGDQLNYKKMTKLPGSWERPSFDLPKIVVDKLIRIIDCYPGPEYSLLDKQTQDNLTQYFAISNQRNKMGIQLEQSIPLENVLTLLSGPVMPGTVQLTPSGKLIILGNNCQTTGGYPRVLYLAESSLITLSQLPSGVKFKFNLLTYNS